MYSEILHGIRATIDSRLQNFFSFPIIIMSASPDSSSKSSSSNVLFTVPNMNHTLNIKLTATFLAGELRFWPLLKPMMRMASWMVQLHLQPKPSQILAPLLVPLPPWLIPTSFSGVNVTRCCSAC
jgi:hypothetical protein